MKNVRLFAVAAALGMFASTVSAAEVTAKPKDTTKEFTSVELSGGEEIIRAEFGGNIVVPNVTVNGYTETRSTALPKNYSLLGGVGYAGFTNKVAVDNNRDGIADSPIISWNADNTSNGFWFYNDAKAFPTLATTMYYLGQTETGIGGRLLAPNQAKNDGYIMVENVSIGGERVNYHGTYANTKAGIEKVVELLIAAGKLEQVVSGDTVVAYRTPAKLTKVASGSDFKKTLVEKAEYTEIRLDQVASESKDKLADLQFAIVNLLSGNEDYKDEVLAAGEEANDVVALYNVTTTTSDSEEVINKLPVAYKVAAGSILTGAYVNTVGNSLTDSYNIPAGSVVVIDGNGAVTKVLTTATGSDADKEIYNDYRSNTRITVVRLTTRYGTEEITSFKPAEIGNAVAYEAIYDKAVEVFTPKYSNTETPVTDSNFDTAAEVNAWIKKGHGLYKVNTPANPSDKYVFMFDLGVYSDYQLDYDFVSTTKKTMTFTLGAKEYTYDAEKIGSKWYPAFDNLEDYQAFLEVHAGFGMVSNATRLAKFKGTRTWANGDTQKDYVPKNGLDHASKGIQLTFASDRKTADVAGVVVTTNVASLDKNKYGVQDLVYSATLNGEVVATKTTKVVIAPKYQRVYKNGKVVDLKAFHLNGNLYAHYAYDYAKNSVTVTFYNTDGVTVDSTSTSSIN